MDTASCAPQAKDACSSRSPCSRTGCNRSLRALRLPTLSDSSRNPTSDCGRSSSTASRSDRPRCRQDPRYQTPRDAHEHRRQNAGRNANVAARGDNSPKRPLSTTQTSPEDTTRELSNGHRAQEDSSRGAAHRCDSESRGPGRSRFDADRPDRGVHRDRRRSRRVSRHRQVAIGSGHYEPVGRVAVAVGRLGWAAGSAAKLGLREREVRHCVPSRSRARHRPSPDDVVARWRFGTVGRVALAITSPASNAPRVQRCASRPHPERQSWLSVGIARASSTCVAAPCDHRESSALREAGFRPAPEGELAVCARGLHSCPSSRAPWNHGFTSFSRGPGRRPVPKAATRSRAAARPHCLATRASV